MSPKTQSSIRSLSLFVGLVAAVTAVTAPITRAMARDVIVRHGESTFVRRDSFQRYQQMIDGDRRVDSVVRAYDRREFNALRADVDTIKKLLRRR